MSEARLVTCDACGADITYTGNCEGYRLGLSSQAVGPREGGGMVTLMHVPNPLPSPRHFCSMRCLQEWVVERMA